MKIAVLLAGQPRGLPIGPELLKKAIVDENQDHEIDFFLHAWWDSTKVGQFWTTAQPGQNNRVGKVQPNTDKFLLDFFKPKKYIIEPQKEFPHVRHLRGEPSAIPEQLCSNFYSTYMANELKKQHEQENGFVYDMVIRTRYDLYYYHPINVTDYTNHLDKIIVMKKFQDDQDNFNSPDRPMVDIFAISNSKNMDVFAGVYPNFEEISKQVSPAFGENILGTHVRVNNKIELCKANWTFQILHRVCDLSNL